MCLGCNGITLVEGACAIDSNKGSVFTFASVEARIVSSVAGHVEVAAHCV